MPIEKNGVQVKGFLGAEEKDDGDYDEDDDGGDDKIDDSEGK